MTQSQKFIAASVETGLSWRSPEFTERRRDGEKRMAEIAGRFGGEFVGGGLCIDGDNGSFDVEFTAPAAQAEALKAALIEAGASDVEISNDDFEDDEILTNHN